MMNTKIYFAGSIRGGREDAEKYEKIIAHLKSFGQVLTEHVGNNKLLKQERTMSDKDIHDRDVAWLEECEYVVAEVTQPSLGVGYELALAMNKGKKVICLFNTNSTRRLSAMISGQPYFKIVNYSKVEEIFPVLDALLS